MRRLLLLAPLAVLVMSGCGSSGDDDGVAGSVPAASDAPVSTTTGDVATTPATASPAPPTTGPGSLRPSGDTVTRESSTPASSLAPTGPTGTPDERAAIADLAQRQGVADDEITVVTVEEVTWRSGAIGCPRPGMAYTQALVPGIRVVLEIDGSRYEYHAGGGRPIFLCEKPEPAASN